MADEASDEKSAKAPDGVFGNLPASRPGTRSPRRDAGGDTAEAGATQSEQRTAKPAPPPPPPPPEPAPEPEATAPAGSHAPGQRIGNLEDLAWAGVAVAAQAATVGVKFASRALEAARKSVDRPD